MPQSGKTRLRLLGLPVIESLEDLETQMRLSKGLIYRLSTSTRSHYRRYEVPKKSGGCRVISQPSRDLKAVQCWILNKLLRPLRPSQASAGFERYSSIRNNAEPHIGARAVLCLDIEDFFPGISRERIFQIFRFLGYPPFISNILANLCTIDDGLPQGGPTSPKLANIACHKLDRRLLGYAGLRGITFTRYADDLTFSSTSAASIGKALPFIKTIIEDEGFNLNANKTRFMGPSTSHRITGLIVTDSSLGIGRQKLRMLRSRIRDLCGNVAKAEIEERVSHLRGWLAFVRDVDPPRFRILESYISRLSVRFPEAPVTELQR